MEIDYMVENSLLKKALGYKIKEVQKITDPDGGLTIKETLKEIPPDTTAQIFWLKNRVKDKWRDVNKVKLQGNMEVDSLQKLSDADLEKLAIKYSIKVQGITLIDQTRRLELIEKIQKIQQQENILKELKVRGCKKSLLAFTEYTKKNYKANWHHKYTARKLDDFITGKIKN